MPSERETPRSLSDDGLRSPGSARHSLTLINHLVRREIATKNRFSFVGAAWPLLRQLAQLAVLVLAFSAVLDLGIDDYPAFVFCGLIGWSWFVIGVNAASTSIRDGTSLAMRPGFPTLVLPVVAVVVPSVDVLFALPVLLIMLALTGELHASAMLFVPLLLLQGVLMIGLGWLVASVSVFLRDLPNLVTLVTLMAFYVTPVFFEVSRVPENYQWLIRLNPVAVLLEADRAVLLGTPFPPWGSFVGVVVISAALFGGGLVLFQRLSRNMADEL